MANKLLQVSKNKTELRNIDESVYLKVSGIEFPDVTAFLSWTYDEFKALYAPLCPNANIEHAWNEIVKKQKQSGKLDEFKKKKIVKITEALNEKKDLGLDTSYKP